MDILLISPFSRVVGRGVKPDMIIATAAKLRPRRDMTFRRAQYV
jgi:hypothetical protein